MNVTAGASSLVNSINLVTEVYFPRRAITSAAVEAALTDLSIATTLMLMVIMPIYGVQYHRCLLMLCR